MSRAQPPAIADFLAVRSFAVVGASEDRAKFGNKVLRCYAQHELPVVGVNPKLDSVEGVACYASLGDAAAAIDGPIAASVVAPPAAAGSIVTDAIAAGVRQLWFQPGAEDPAASAAARAAGIAVIDDGSCLLVALG